MGFQGGTVWMWPEAGGTESTGHTAGSVPEGASLGLASLAQGPAPAPSGRQPRAGGRPQNRGRSRCPSHSFGRKMDR